MLICHLRAQMIAPQKGRCGALSCSQYGQRHSINSHPSMEIFRIYTGGIIWWWGGRDHHQLTNCSEVMIVIRRRSRWWWSWRNKTKIANSLILAARVRVSLHLHYCINLTFRTQLNYNMYMHNNNNNNNTRWCINSLAKLCHFSGARARSRQCCVC